MATIIDLLMALNRGELPALPAPANPMSLGPLQPEGPTNFEFAPELPPDAPMPALDRGIIDRTVALAGAAPTPPAPRGTLERVANALMGFSAGVQGQGGQFLQQLNEPQRRYEAQVADFNQRRSELGLRGTMAAEDKAERQRMAQQRRAEKEADRDFDLWVRRLNLRDDEAKLKAREVFELEKEKRQREETERKEKALFKRQLFLQIDDRIKAYRDQGAGDHSEELARNDFRSALGELGETVKPLSAAAKKANVLVQARLKRALDLANGRTRGAASGNAASLERQFKSLKAQFLRAELGTPSAPRGDRGLQERLATKFRAVMEQLAKLGYEVGFDASGIYPYIKPPQGKQQAAPAPQAQQNDPGDFRRY